MQSTDQELARRMLSAILDKIEGGSQHQSDHQTIPPDEILSTAGDESGIILIVIGRLDLESGRSENAISKARAEIARNGNIHQTAVATHPGLEKFPISERASTDKAARPCFMEPNRACVNSGACEMRGY